MRRNISRASEPPNRETLRLDIRAEAARIAEALGVDVEAALAEAERILARTDR